MKFLNLSIQIVIIATFLLSCNSSQNNVELNSVLSIDSNKVSSSIQESSPNEKNIIKKVLIYNFHLTNRCSSCIAIEEATTKTLNTYFAEELRKGLIERKILNVDENENASIAEKYQAFGSALFVTQVVNETETTTDLTGDGFKYARSKEEKFVIILKEKITEYLK